MTLEEIKEQHEDEGFITDDEGHEVISWLITEVERQRLIISGKTACDERKAAAMRCKEIADKGNTPGIIARAIKKEFNL